MAREVKKLSMGTRIRRAREAEGLSLEQVANDTGRSVDYLEKIENDEVMPPVAVLLQITRAMDLDQGMLLRDNDEKEQKRQEEKSKRADHYSYTVLSSPSTKRHLSAYLVGIDPHTEHEGASYQHEGEEFSYIISGRVEITVGDNVNRLGPGDSLHFNSNLVHKLKNPGDEPAQWLVVLYTP